MQLTPAEKRKITETKRAYIKEEHRKNKNKIFEYNARYLLRKLEGQHKEGKSSGE